MIGFSIKPLKVNPLKMQLQSISPNLSTDIEKSNIFKYQIINLVK